MAYKKLTLILKMDLPDDALVRFGNEIALEVRQRHLLAGEEVSCVGAVDLVEEPDDCALLLANHEAKKNWSP